MKHAIETVNLRKEFDSKVAVDNLNLYVEEGEVFAFLGVNGAGKTTTIRMLTGLTAPTAGDAFVYGHSIVSDLDSVKKLGNLSPQETSVAPNLSVKENLEFLAGIYGVDKEKTAERVPLFPFSCFSYSHCSVITGISGGLNTRGIWGKPPSPRETIMV